MMFQRTPTRTPTRSLLVPGGSVRRSPRVHAHFDDSNIFNTPMTATINQMLSDAHEFGIDMGHSPLRGLNLDLSNLPSLEGSGHGLMDFGSMLSTDAIMPSSPPGLRKTGLTFDYMGDTSVWAADWDPTQETNVEEDE